MEQARKPTLPPLDENVLVRVLYWEVQIDRHGSKWCNANLIGAMRRKAATPRFTNVSMITDGVGRTFEEVRVSTARRLATFCALCAKCDMSKVPPE